MNELAFQMEEFAAVFRLPVRNTYERPTRLLGAILDHRQRAFLCRFFSERDPDVIHVNQQVAEDGLDFLLSAKRSGISFVSTIHIPHGADFLAARWSRLRDTVAIKTLRHIGATHIVVSKKAREVLRKRFGLYGAPLYVVYNGVSNEELADPRSARQQARAEWQVGAGDIVLGSMGRLEEQKNPLFLLELLASVRNRGVPAKLVWIGDGELTRAYVEKANALGLTNSIINDGWREDAQRRLHGLDIFVMASKYEGLPLALLEAMHAGLPCCVSDLDGMPEVIEHGRTGYLCALGDAEIWSQTVARLASDAALRERLGQAASVEAKQRFCTARMGADTQAVYQAAICANAASRTSLRR